MDMTPAEYQAARAQTIRQSREAKPAPPPDTRPVSEMSYQEWEAARGPKPKPKLATQMTKEEYAKAKADLIRR
jgi:hypothetical protein